MWDAEESENTELDIRQPSETPVFKAGRLRAELGKSICNANINMRAKHKCAYTFKLRRERQVNLCEFEASLVYKT